MSRCRPRSPSQARAGATPIPTNRRIPAIARFIVSPPIPVQRVLRMETRIGLRSFAGFGGKNGESRATFLQRQIQGLKPWSTGRAFSRAFLPDSRRFVGGLVWAFHFVADALGEFFDFIRFLDYFERENILIGLVNVFLQFERQLQQPVGIGLQCSDALLGGFLLHVVRDAGASFVVVESMVDIRLRMRNGLLSECWIAK